MVIDPTRARLLRDLDGHDGEDRAVWIGTAPLTHLQQALAADPSIGTDAALHHDAEEFLDQTLGFLATERRAKRFDRLAIFAEPSIFALIELKLPASLQPGLILQRARGLMRLPEPSLRRRLREMIDQSKGTNHDDPDQQGSD